MLSRQAGAAVWKENRNRIEEKHTHSLPTRTRATHVLGKKRPFAGMPKHLWIALATLCSARVVDEGEQWTCSPPLSLYTRNSWSNELKL